MARVSVINDSDEFLGLMHDLLDTLGHQMTGFKALEASIEQVVDSRPELLIVDLRLQDKPQEISGWELIILARSHRQLMDVPIILCTADVWELTKRATTSNRSPASTSAPNHSTSMRCATSSSGYSMSLHEGGEISQQ